jgi:O-antigen/teichoic acid export membrane protein
MSFKIYAIRTLVATSVGGAVGLAMAFNGSGAYAIVAQQIALFVVTNAVVWPSAGWRPKRTFQLRGLIKDIKPGFELMCSNVLGFLEGEFPRFIIGRFLGPTSLGHYAFVIRLRYALANALIIPPLAVLYPAFTKINDDKEEQRAIAGKIILLFGMILFPALAIAIATAPLYVPLLFGKIWTPTIPLLQIFIFGLCYWPFQAIVFQLFRAHGRMRIYLTVNAVSVLASIIMTFLIFLPNGLKLMAIGVVAFMSVMQAVFLIILQRQLDINLWKYVMNLWPSAVTALCVFVVMEFFNQSGLFLTAPWVKLLVLLLLGSATGVLGTLLLQRKLLKDALRFGRELLKKTDDPNTVLNAAPCFECEKNV